MPAELIKNGEVLEVHLSGCRGMEFQDALAKVKDIPGRRFETRLKDDGQEEKFWALPAEPSVAERAANVLMPKMSNELSDWIIAARVNQEVDLTTKLPDDADLLVPWATKRMPWQPEEVNDEEFNGLFDWQRSSVDHLATHARAILADDMGLGKTLQAISAVEEFRLRNKLSDGYTVPDGPKLVVCPNSVKGSWARELNRWLEDPTVALIEGTYSTRKARAGEHDRLGNKPDDAGTYPDKLTADEVRRLHILDAIEKDAWIIVNWEQLRVVREVVKLQNGGRKVTWSLKEPLFEKTKWLAVIADEAHHAKNRQALQTKGLWRCQGQLMLALTGTPIMNSPDELWSVLRWLWPKPYASMGYHRFDRQYVDSYEVPGQRGRMVTGVKNPDALRFELVNKVVRRTADLLGLEGRKRFFYDVDLLKPQRKLYEEAKDALWLEVKQAAAGGNRDAQEIMEALEADDVTALYSIKNGGVRTTRLRQIIETPANLGGKDDSALLDDCIERILDSQPTQWIVFTEFLPTVDCIVKRLEKKDLTVATYTGGVTGAQKTKIEDAYQARQIDVVVGTIKAMYQGITLTAGHNQHWVSRTWVPDVNEQGESRQDRLGQQKRVNVWIPQAVDTVAVSKVETANRTKERIVRSVLPKVKIEEEYL